MLGSRSIQAIALLVDGDLGYHWQLRVHIASRQNGLVQLFQVSKGLQDNQVDAFFVQGCNLLVKGCPGFIARNLAQRLDAYSQGSNRAGDQGVKTLCRLPGQPGAVAIDVSQLVQTSVLRQTKRIRAKGVGFNNVRPGMQVFLMDATDQVGLRDVEFVVAAVDENAFGIQQGAHGAIA